MDNLDSKTLGVLFSVLHVATAIISVIGNIILIRTIILRKAMAPVLNYLIVNIAIADILYAISFSVVLFPVFTMRLNWTLGDFGCKLFHMFHATTIVLVPSTLVAISMVLLKLIGFPSQKPFTKREGFKIVISLCGLSFFVGLPNWIFANVAEYDVAVCMYKAPINKLNIIEFWYEIVVSVSSVLLPAVWITIAYAIIWWVGFRSYKIDGRTHEEIHNLKYNKNMVKMMAVSSAVYFICCTIKFLLWIQGMFGGTSLLPKSMFMLISWVLSTAALCRPLIYLVMNARFRSNI